MKTEQIEQRLRDEMPAAGGLESLAADLREMSHRMRKNDDDLDVRLRYFRGFELLTGDSSYDQDHRGWWGASSIGPKMTASEARDTASALFDDLLECACQDTENASDVFGE